LNNLIERFIAAMEKIADALSAPAFPTKPCACEPKAVPAEYRDAAAKMNEASEAAKITAPVYAQEMAGPPAGYKGITDYEALKKLCAERGIEVPPRTKTTTLIKNLSTWDAVQSAQQIVNKPTAAPAEVIPPAVQEPDPPTVLGPVSASPESDPFQEPPAAPEPPKARTFEETLVVLQSLMKVRGNAYVSAMIKKHTGFDAYKDVKKLEKPAQDAALTALFTEATQELN